MAHDVRSLDALLQRLPPVSLDELDRRAALQRRVDTKYLLASDTLEELVAALADEHEALEIDGLRSFRYESVYFDTPDLRSFREHVEGRAPRFKVRSRLYVDSAHSVFELKVRLPDGETVKESIDQDPAEHGRLTPAAHRFLAERLPALTGDHEPPSLEPTLITRFERATLAARAEAERLTVDRDLVLARPDGPAVRLLDDRVIAESKSDDGEGRADRALRERGVEPVAFSKYRTGVGLLMAEDPDPPLHGEPERWFRPAGDG
jgi:hypothetical protein